MAITFHYAHTYKINRVCTAYIMLYILCIVQISDYLCIRGNIRVHHVVILAVTHSKSI